jgi:hypothetical protein
MIELTIEDKTFNIAESWSEITFQQYIDIINIAKENINELEKAVKIIAFVSDKPEECEQHLLKIERTDFEELAKWFEWTSKTIENFKEEKDFVEIDGKKYKIKKDYNKLSLGEMISVETLISNNKNLEPFEIAFGVLLRETLEDGSEKEFNEDDFLHIIKELKSRVMLMDVYNHISFFLSGVQTSTTETSKAFSIRKKEKTL